MCSDALCCTHAELQAKSYEGSSGRAPLQQDDAPRSTKRYLILTYAAEFDKIQYPLPLCAEDNPKPEFFRSIIKRLRAEKEASIQVSTPCTLKCCILLRLESHV